MNSSFSVAIDGPAGSGKSSISREISRSFGFDYLDSGAFYRTLAWFLFAEGVLSPNNNNENEFSMDLYSIKFDIIDGMLFINGVFPGENIRTPQISNLTSEISTWKCVRSFVTEQIRNVARGKKVIMDGRDIGTVVLPNADVKIFLTASSKVRALRRYREWLVNGIELDVDEVEREIIERDVQDSSRKISPLKPAPDSLEIDTSDMSFDDVVSKIEEIISSKIACIDSEKITNHR